MWIYLSPHFDDAILSCGGLIWQQARSRGRVEVWTVCAGEPPPGPLTPFAQELHARWGSGPSPVAVRRGEDEIACQAVGAARRCFTLPDCIYRRLPDSGEPVVTQDDDLWRPLNPGEYSLVREVREWIRQELDDVVDADPGSKIYLVSPMTVGSHMDHRLVRRAAEELGVPLWYYADFPYSVRTAFDPHHWLGGRCRPHARRLTPAAVVAWQAGVWAYTSQISTFWGSSEEMRLAIASYAQTPPGHSLWKRAFT